MSNHKKKLFLFTCFTDNYLYGGGAIIRELLPHLAKKFDIQWYYYNEYPNPNALDEAVSMYAKTIPIPIPSKRRFLNTAIDYYLFYSYLPSYARKVMDLISPQDTVWLILEQKIIPLAYAFANKKRFQLHISVHDCCRYYYDVYRWIGRAKTDSYLSTIFHKADSADFIGYKLLEDYQRRFGASGTVFRRGMETDDVRINTPQQKDAYNLLFVGSSHAEQSWVNLLQKLSIFTKKFTLTIYAQKNHLEKLALPPNVQVIFEGTKPEASIMAQATRFDFGVFFWEYMREEVAQFSVSTKLTTYTRMGLPLMASIAANSEVYDLFEYGLAFDISKSQDSFVEWVNSFDAQSYGAYLQEKFNRKQLINDFLACAAFNK